MFGLHLFVRYSRGVPDPSADATSPQASDLAFERALDSPLYQEALVPVIRLYFAYFDRPADVDGVKHWVRQRLGGMALDDIANAFATSPEFAARVGPLSDEAFMGRLFRRTLGVEPGADALAFWREELRRPGVTRGDVVYRFASSPDFEAYIAPEVYVAVMYFVLLGRSADPAGFRHWVDRRRAGRHPVAQLVRTPEYASRSASYS